MVVSGYTFAQKQSSKNNVIFQMSKGLPYFNQDVHSKSMLKYNTVAWSAVAQDFTLLQNRVMTVS